MSYSEIGRAFKAMVNQYGIRGLFKGLLPTVMRDAPFSAIYWTCYESYKKQRGCTQPDLFDSFFGGALAGGIAAFITTPFDVIKTHQQIEFGEKFLYNTNGNKTNGKKKMTGTLQTMKNIMRSGGIPGFFSGLTPRLFKVVSACAVMISSYELGKKFFFSHNVTKYYKENPLEQTTNQEWRCHRLCHRLNLYKFRWSIKLMILTEKTCKSLRI